MYSEEGKCAQVERCGEIDSELCKMADNLVGLCGIVSEAESRFSSVCKQEELPEDKDGKVPTNPSTKMSGILRSNNLTLVNCVKRLTSLVNRSEL